MHSARVSVDAPVWPAALVGTDDPLIVDAYAHRSIVNDADSDAISVDEFVLEGPDALSSAPDAIREGNYFGGWCRSS